MDIKILNKANYLSSEIDRVNWHINFIDKCLNNCSSRRDSTSVSISDNKGETLRIFDSHIESDRIIVTQILERKKELLLTSKKELEKEWEAL